MGENEEQTKHKENNAQLHSDEEKTLYFRFNEYNKHRFVLVYVSRKQRQEYQRVLIRVHLDTERHNYTVGILGLFDICMCLTRQVSVQKQLKSIGLYAFEYKIT